jgi:integrase
MGKQVSTRVRLTASVIKAIESGKTIYDERVPNLGLRVSPRGRRTYFVLGKGGERATLGTFPQIKIESARILAEETNVLMAQGKSPRKVKQARKAELTWQNVWEDYRENRQNKRKDTASKTLNHQWNKHLSRWSDRRLSDISFDEARRFILNLRKDTPVAANRIQRQGKAMFNHAIKELRWEGKNPFEFSQLSEKGRERDRSVSKDELRRLFAAFDELQSQSSADLFRMCIYTGQRVGNIREMHFSDVDTEEGVWFIQTTKQGKPHKAVLATAAMELLEGRETGSDLVFPGKLEGKPVSSGGYKKAWERVLKLAEIDNLTVHDLRSVHTTQNLEAGIVEKIQQQLGHATPEMTQRYLRPGVGLQRLQMDAAIEQLNLKCAEISN